MFVSFSYLGQRFREGALPQHVRFAGYNQFNYFLQWMNKYVVYVSVDLDKSGTLDFDELYDAIRSTGLKVTSSVHSATQLSVFPEVSRQELLFVIKGSEHSTFYLL